MKSCSSMIACVVVAASLSIAQAGEQPAVEPVSALLDAPGGFSSSHLAVKVRPGIRVVDGAIFDASSVSRSAGSGLNALLKRWDVVSIEPAIQHDLESDLLATVLGLDRFYVVTLAPGTDVAALASELREHDLIIERADLVGIAQQHLIPNDTLFGEQYALENIGQDIDGVLGTPGADIRAVDAWDMSVGDPDVVVAVLDAGVADSHPDLSAQLVTGRNFNDGDPGNTNPVNNSHGTYVAGLVAATGNNAEGIVGVAYECSIMPIRILNDLGWGFEFHAANGYTWAADNGADIAVMSAGISAANGGLLHTAIQYSLLQDVVLVASTGNVPGASVNTPARWPEVIGVGATDNRDAIWPNTTTGPEMSVCAPGVDVISTWNTTSQPASYRYDSGTSASAPIVAGVIALMRSAAPSLPATTLAHILERSADDLLTPGHDNSSGWGRVNAVRAVEWSIIASINFDKSGDNIVVPGDCLVDLNGDTILDAFDVIEYLGWYSSGDMRADWTEPEGQLDFFDLLAFLTDFAQGC